MIALERGRARIRNDETWAELDASQCGLYISDNTLEVVCADEHGMRISSCSAPRSVTSIGTDGLQRTNVNEASSDRISTLLRVAHALPDGTNPDQLRLRDHLGEAILLSFVAESGVALDHTVPLFVRKARSHLEEHFAMPCDLGELAATVGVRKEHLVSVFRRHIGTTPVRYMWDLRTRHAVRLVQTTRMTLADIASAAGYKSHFHLSREIKRTTGATPRELRGKG